ncbi:PiggyBac transposable element-derived protein 4 [Merluccius polli]|uniref:PiggyBac transposable element-derived protein 4 n=1 Tax=Merluccius polli TaxID=89951 RepID=A0AA47N738_MERPO|nr:PiggyBac transposable element-derived protein 4 [Merluccius polli]
MALVDFKRLGLGYKLYVDDFYAGCELFRDLLRRDVWACGTMRPHRGGFPRTRVNDFPEGAPRGSVRWLRRDGLLFTKWLDKREVVMCSTMHKAYDDDTCQRRVKRGGRRQVVGVPIPPAVLDYNKIMGSVDLWEEVAGHHQDLHRTCKWYQSFFYHFLDIAVVNAHILHKQLEAARGAPPAGVRSQKSFREELVLQLVGEGSLSSSAAVPSEPPAAQGPHNLKYSSSQGESGALSSKGASSKRRRCTLCSRSTSTMCETCKLFLCFQPTRDCYNAYHRQNNLY